MKSLVAIEDDDVKWRDVESVLEHFKYDLSVVRAKSILEAEQVLDSTPSDLLLLDISMGIVADSSTGGRAAHANLGGVEIVHRLWLLGLDTPTIILTGFDYFKSQGKKTASTEIYNLNDLETKVRSFMNDKLLSCIKYGDTMWKFALQDAINDYLRKS